MNLFVRCLCFIMCLYSWSSVDAKETAGTAQLREKTTLKEESKMSKATQVAAKHILVSTEQEAKDILAKIKSKESENSTSFEDAAKEFSQCPSGSKGGDLGFFGRNMMVKEFEDVAFSMNVGEISNPVKTQFGWHLIKVYDKK